MKCYTFHMDELWDIARVAAYLGVSERTVYTKVRSGVLPAIRVGRLWRVRESDLKVWLGEPAVVPAPGGAAVAAEPGVVPTRAELETLLGPVSDPVLRRMLFVALLSKGVVALGWSAPVIVGGYAVQFYTAGDYPTVDVDLAGASEPIAHVLGAWGFERLGRHWYDDALNLVIEAPGGQLDSGEYDHVVKVRVGAVVASVLGIEDLIIDRLAACVFWNDGESCLWAEALLKVAQDLDVEYLEQKAAEEDVADKLAELRRGA